MAHASPRFRHGVAGSLRRLALCATLAVPLAVIPRAFSQEEPDTGEAPAGPVEPAPDETPVAAREPGAASEVTAVGWGAHDVAVTYVEGAAPDAPLVRAAKPRPQGDAFVQRISTRPPQTFNPLTATDPAAGAVLRHVVDRLVEVDPDHPPNALGVLAAEWEVTESGKRCTYRLRRGVQFADGRPFTSADVQYSYDVLQDPRVPADHLRPALEKVQSLETPDAETVVVTFASRHWKAPYVIGRRLPILNKGWYESHLPSVQAEGEAEPRPLRPGEPGFAEAFEMLRLPCPGTGPYQLASESDVTRRDVRIVPNPFSWRMQVHPRRHNFDALRWLYLPTEGDAFFAFTRGELDIWVVSHAAWEHQLSRDPRVDGVGRFYVYDHIGIDCSAIFWNCRKPPFDDASVRRAMTLMTDREAILQNVDQGHGTIASCKSKPAYPTYSDDIEPWPFDLAQAEALLIRAGWSRDSDGDGVLDKDGQPFRFELTYPAGRREFHFIAETLERSCRELKIDLVLHPVDGAEFVDAVRLRRFDAIVGFSSWPDPWIDLSDRYSRAEDVRGGGNITGWRDARVTELLKAMQGELDEQKRTAMHHELNRIFHTQQPETLLVHGKVGVLLNKRFEGVSIRPTGLQSFDLWVPPEPQAAADPENQGN